MVLTVPGGLVKTAFFIFIFLAAPATYAFPAAEATPAHAQIITELPSGAKAHGFHENFESRETPKICFQGSANNICKDLRKSISTFNRAMASRGVSSKVDVKTCAQSVKLGMVIYSLRPVDDDDVVSKTVYVRECK